MVPVKELMIGDWVKPFGSKDGIYAKVTTLDCDGRFGLITNGGNPHHGTEDTVEPVPLTVEILERNGFEKDWRDSYQFMDDDEGLEITFFPKEVNYTDGAYDCVDIFRGCLSITDMPVKFVHELQHALKLCESKKVIEL